MDRGYFGERKLLNSCMLHSSQRLQWHGLDCEDPFIELCHDIEFPK